MLSTTLLMTLMALPFDEKNNPVAAADPQLDWSPDGWCAESP
jgi:hypothetical protein